MLTYATYAEAGGVGKTSLASALAHAHTRNGRSVLVVDLDPQDGDLSYLHGVDDDRDRDDVDTITHHLAGAPRGPLDELIHTTTEGFDVVPAHNSLAALGDWLSEAADLEDDFDPNRRLQEVLLEAGIPDRYDTLIVDPPATEGPQLYNALTATRNVVIPIELSGKGQQSIEGLSDLVDGLEAQIGAEVGVVAVVPNGVKHTTDQQHYRELIEELGYDVPVVIGDRASLFEGCWRQQCSAFQYVEEHRDRRRDYETETLEKIETLANHLESTNSQ